MNIKSILNRSKQTLLKQKAVVAIVGMIVLMAFFKTPFFTSNNWINILRGAATQEIVAFGVTMTVLCAACDLSVGSIMCLSGVVCVMMLNSGFGLFISIICGMLSGIVVGFINGFLVVQQRTEPFIITLGMGILIKGVCQVLTNAHPLSCDNLEFMKVANGKVFGSVPSIILYMLILLVIFIMILRFTSYGRNCYAIGGNYEVAKYSGINVVAIKWSTFVISGAMSAFAGILLSSRMNSASSIYGDNTGMLVNCGVVIGGTSFAGGVGGIMQSFVGVLVLQLMTNCMDNLGMGAYVQKLLQGVVVVLILGFDCLGRKRKREAV